MKQILSIVFILAIALVGCDQKKKQLIPIQSLAQESAPTTTSVGNTGSNANTANTNNPASVATVSIPSSTSSTATLADTQPSATVTVNPSGNTPFTYQTNTTIPVNMTVTDNQGNPVSPATVTITNPTENNVLLQQVTDASGNVTGTVTVPSTTTQVNVTITSGGSTSQPVVVPLQVPVTTNGTTTNQPIGSIGNVTLPISNPTGNGTQIADRDGDGIDDQHDFYPDDPKKATKIRFPATGVNTISFEDLYPNAGDADLNDYVVQFYNEEDLNAQGQIVEVRGAYQHVARGAGYRHKLNLLFPNTVNISYESTITDAAGVPNNTGITKFTPTAAQLDAGLTILGNSGNTISSQNVELNQTYAPGHVAKVSVIFNTPVARSVIGSAPYNVYLQVIDTSKNIFFPGRYFDADGKDLYMDSNGFPWAIMVPGVWAWPLERQDIRNASVTGYSRFNSWATSKGVNDKDWYTTVTSGKVYPLPSEPSSLLAYLKGTESNTNLFIAISLAVFGISMGIILRKKLKSA